MRTPLLGTLLTGSLLVLGSMAGCGSERDNGFDEDGGTSSGASGGASGGASNGGIGGSSGASGNTDGGSSGNTGPTCATATANTNKQPIYLQIILDGSGSMDGYARVSTNQASSLCNSGTFNEDPFGGTGLCQLRTAAENDPLQDNRKTGKKWIAARDALKAFFDAKAADNSDQLGVGLLFFHSEVGGDTSETEYERVDLARVDGEQADRLWSVIRPPMWPWGGTPLSNSMNRATQTLTEFTPGNGLAPDGRRAILMVTDGVPTPGNNQSQQQANQQVKSRVEQALAADPSIATAIIGVGNPADNTDIYNPRFLSDLANVGGVAAAGCDPNWTEGSSAPPCHLQVTPGEKSADQIKAEIIAAIESIAGSLVSCELTLNKTSPIEPSKVNVIYVDSAGASTQVPQDGENGWTYDNPDDPSKVILHGQSCDRLKADTESRVDIVIGCPTGTSVVN